MNLKALLLMLCAILAGFGLFKGSRRHAKERGSPLVQGEKPFVIIIPSYNNSAFVEKNLRSVFAQNYKNYRVIYIDDHSADDTHLKAKKIIAELQQSQRTHLIRNEQNLGALANLYNAIHSCQDQEIIVLVDGDDFLAHEQVLSILNQAYQDPSVWMTYGNFLDYPAYSQYPVRCKEISEGVIRRNSFRKQEWVATHLRTFYASLFKKIALRDLVYRGRFFPMGWDLAFMLPLLEMSGPHVKFIKEILYLYNRNNPISDHRVNFSFQQECALAVRAKKPYARLQELKSASEGLGVDIAVLYSGDPMQLHTLLDSLNRYAAPIGKITVLCPLVKRKDAILDELEQAFPAACFVYTDKFKEAVLKLVEENPLDKSRYLLLAQDQLVLKDFISLQDSAELLQKTEAFGLYFSLGAHLAEDQTLLPVRHAGAKESLLGWQPSCSSGPWKNPAPLDLVLYSKKELKNLLATAPFNSREELAALLENGRPADAPSLFYATAKCAFTKQ
jgi:glycosyltransferase involved in cell wall biosynthesis